MLLFLVLLKINKKILAHSTVLWDSIVLLLVKGGNRKYFRSVYKMQHLGESISDLNPISLTHV